MPALNGFEVHRTRAAWGFLLCQELAEGGGCAQGTLDLGVPWPPRPEKGAFAAQELGTPTAGHVS